MGNLLEGKKILVMGAANRRSIAWGCASVMQEQGAQLIYTYQNERLKKSLLKLVGDEERLVECDVSSDESIQAAFQSSRNVSARSTALFMRLHLPLNRSLKATF